MRDSQVQVFCLISGFQTISPDFQQSVVNFINILHAHFSFEKAYVLLPKPKCNLSKAARSTFVQKNVRKMLLKLTPG